MTEKPERDVTPFDLINPRKPRTDAEVKAERMSICEGCEFFRKHSRRCAKCGCFMDLKTTLQQAKCPVGKW
jgi:uncharacterized paraquat-inducible protein A